MNYFARREKRANMFILVFSGFYSYVWLIQFCENLILFFFKYMYTIFYFSSQVTYYFCQSDYSGGSV